MVLTLGWFGVALVLRRRFQFSIRSLLALVVVVALPCSWTAVEMKAAREQKAVVEAIRRADGDIVYDWSYGAEWWEVPWRKPPVPEWIANWLGDDLFYDIAKVYFPADWHYTAKQCDDNTLLQLRCLTKLKHVELTMTNVTDEGVAKLQQALPNCRITR